MLGTDGLKSIDFENLNCHSNYGLVDIFTEWFSKNAYKVKKKGYLNNIDRFLSDKFNERKQYINKCCPIVYRRNFVSLFHLILIKCLYLYVLENYFVGIKMFNNDTFYYIYLPNISSRNQ